MLDLCRPDVRDFVVDTIDALLTQHRGITYLKWDANRDITEPGSGALSDDSQTHLAVDRVRHTWDVMAGVAARHPDVEMMLCAARWWRPATWYPASFHELWTSDNTDPVTGCGSSGGASHLLPVLVLGAHVTRWGLKPVPFACAVALSGRFGFTSTSTSLSDHEWSCARRAVAVHHRIRDVVQHGELFRLESPVGTDRGSLAYLAPDRSRSVVFMFRLDDEDLGSSPGGAGVHLAEGRE